MSNHATRTSTGDQNTRNIQKLPTVEAYNLWAASYDTDGNILQSLDSLALTETLLPRFLSTLSSTIETEQTSRALSIFDLGCGTGRASTLLIQALQSPANAPSVLKILTSGNGRPQDLRPVKLIAFDASAAMLNVAQQRIHSPQSLSIAKTSDLESSETSLTATFHIHDILDPTSSPLLPCLNIRGNADVLISTLVLEHVPPATFFAFLAAQLRSPGGVALVTNMHHEMGHYGSNQDESSSKEAAAGTAAGFRDVKTGVKVRGHSWVWSVDEIVAAAAEAGFEVAGEVEERSVTRELVEARIVSERGWKWVRAGVKCWFGMVLRRI